MKQSSVCPSCKSGTLAKNRTFQTRTEAVGELPSAVVTIDMMKCERCNAAFPAVRGKTKYTLVPGRKLTELVQEVKNLEEKNLQMVQQLGTTERRRIELADEINKSRVADEISLLETKVESLESGVTMLERGRKRIEEAVNAIALRSHLSIKDPLQLENPRD